MGHQVQAHPASITASERQGRACPAHALEEFRPTIDLRGTNLPDRLAEWQTFYNWQRPLDLPSGKAPIERVRELISKTALITDIVAAYDPSKEFMRVNDYAWDATIPRPRR